MFLRVSYNNINKSDTFMIECEGKKRPIDSFSKNASFDCGEQVNCHANVEFVPRNGTMRFASWVLFVIKEIITSILFFLVFDKGPWYENIDPIRVKKKITFKPAPSQSGELAFELKKSVFNKKTAKYTLPQINVQTNGVILSEEVGYLPNLGGVKLGFIHYVFEIMVPSVILLALCVYGILWGIFASNIVLTVLLSICALLIVGFVVVMLYRGTKMRKCVENIIISQIKHLIKNA